MLESFYAHIRFFERIAPSSFAPLISTSVTIKLHQSWSGAQLRSTCLTRPFIRTPVLGCDTPSILMLHSPYPESIIRDESVERFGEIQEGIFRDAPSSLHISAGNNSV